MHKLVFFLFYSSHLCIGCVKTSPAGQRCIQFFWKGTNERTDQKMKMIIRMTNKRFSGKNCIWFEAFPNHFPPYFSHPSLPILFNRFSLPHSNKSKDSFQYPYSETKDLHFLSPMIKTQRDSQGRKKNLHELRESRITHNWLLEFCRVNNACIINDILFVKYMTESYNKQTNKLLLN